MTQPGSIILGHIHIELAIVIHVNESNQNSWNVKYQTTQQTAADQDLFSESS